MSEESKKRFFSKITKSEELDNGVVSLAIRPNQPSNYGQGSLSGKQLQERFDRLAGLIIERYNEMATGLSSDEALEYFKLPKVDGKQITLGTGADEKVDLSSFIKKISNTTGDLVVETPYENSTVTTIKSILAQIYSDLQEIDANFDNYATKAALQEHSEDVDATDKDVTDAHPSIRNLIPVLISDHNGNTSAHSDIRKEIDDDIVVHNKATDTHQDIRDKIGTDIALHNSDKDAAGNVVTTTHPEIRKEIDDDIDVHNNSDEAHEDIRKLIDGIIGEDGTLTQLEEVVNAFLANATNENLDNLKEIVDYIELNRETIDRIIGANGAAGLLDDKIDKTSIVTNIPTDDDTDTDTKVLAASVGKTIKNELDKRVLIVDGDPVVRVSGLQGYAVESDQNPIVRANTLKDYAQTTTNDGTVVRETNEIPVARKSDLSVYALETENGATVVRETNNTLVARKSDLDDFVKDSNDNPIVRGGNIGSYLTDYAKETNGNNETIVRQTSETPVARLSDILTITDIEDAGFFKEDSQDPVVTQNDLNDYAKEESNGDPIVRQNALDGQLENYALETDAAGSVVREKANNPVIKQDALDRALAGFTGGSSQFTDAFAAELLRLFGTNGTKGLAYYINGLAGVGRAWCCGKGESTETDITIGYLAEGCAVYVVRGFGETDITSVVIPEGITIIESKTFYHCGSLTQVTLPDSLNTIGIRAFEKCDNLEHIHISDIAKWCRIIFDDGVSQPLQNKKCKLCINGIILEDLVIPDNVKEISQLAFYGYQFLKSVVINDVVTELYANTFYKCSNLKSITLGKGINNIVRSPVMPIFNNCSSLENIMVNEENAYYKSIDGNLYERENSAIMQYAVGKKDASFLLPDNVERIGHHAFNSAANLISVRLRGNLHEIGDSAFAACSNLTTVKIEYGCDITEIPYECFGYSNLKYINIPRSVTRIYGYAFHSCPLTEVYYDGSEDEWNAITINSYNEALNNANIYFASQGLEYVYDDEVCSVVGVGECTNTEIMIPSRDENSDTPVAFLGNMTGEDNPDHNATFNYGNNITYLRIPENIRGIAENAFANCETIKKVRIATDISRYAFYNCANLTEVIIEPGVDFISGYAFYGCTALNSIYIPISVTEIGEFAFAHARNLNIYYEGTQEQWIQIDKANQWDGYANGKINYNQRG